MKLVFASIVMLAEIASTTMADCPPEGVWGEWTVTGACSTTCGSCSTAARKRVCSKECGDCPCTGPSEDVGPCGISLCPFPSTATCCKPYVKSLNGQLRNFFCGSEEVKKTECPSAPKAPTFPTTPEPAKAPSCPPEGVWSEWTVTGTCSTTCGSCSKAARKRVCSKECGDCPCTGPSEDVGPCGTSLCPFPSTVTCCAPFKKSLNYQTSTFFCGPDSVAKTVCPSTAATTTPATPVTKVPSANCPPGGVWSEWTVTGVCPTTCGGCSKAARKRTCTTKCGDCPCTGPSEDEGPCGLALCSFPKRTCCPPFKKSLVDNRLVCGTGEVPPVVKCAP